MQVVKVVCGSQLLKVIELVVFDMANFIQKEEDFLGVFHLPKDSGKFREFRWEMFIGEERVPFDTRSIHSRAPFSV